MKMISSVSVPNLTSVHTPKVMFFTMNKWLNGGQINVNVVDALDLVVPLVTPFHHSLPNGFSVTLTLSVKTNVCFFIDNLKQGVIVGEKW